MLVGSTPGKDMNASIKQVEPNRNFINKVWNASRFIITSLDKVTAQPTSEPEWTLADSWIWSRLQELIRTVERLFQTYQYGEAGRQIYDFFWSEFADWYIEIAKLQMLDGGDRSYYTASTLVRVLDLCLRLLHPFAPFVTEEIWDTLKQAVNNGPLVDVSAGWEEHLIIASWPQPRPIESWESQVSSDFDLVEEVIRSIRNIRAEKNVKPGKRIAARLAAGEKTDLFHQQKNLISALALVDPEQFEISTSLPPKTEDEIGLAVGSVEIHLPLAGLVDQREERERVSRALSEAESQATRLEKLLASSFAERAPADIVQKEREKLANYKETVELLKKQLESLN